MILQQLLQREEQQRETPALAVQMRLFIVIEEQTPSWREYQGKRRKKSHGHVCLCKEMRDEARKILFSWYS